MRRLAALALLVAGGLLVGLALAELALRVAERPGPDDLRPLHDLRPGRAWLYGMRPGAEVVVNGGDGPIRYAVNADGFRDPARRRVKPADTFRIEALGDSLTFGWGVPDADTYPRRLEALLAAHVDRPRIEVLNLGVSGYNPYTEAALFTDVGRDYAPDLVLVQFCINDLNDPTLHFDHQTAARLGPLAEEAYPDPSARRSAPARGLPWCTGLRLCARLERLLVPPDPDRLREALVAHADPSPREVAWLRARYGDIARAARDIRAHAALVVFPWAAQLDPGTSTAVQRAVGGVARELGWPAIDLLPAFRAAAAADGPLFRDPWHPTARGYRVAAETIAAQLVCAGLVPVAAGGDCPPS